MSGSSILGQPVRRVDGGEKVAGLTRFAGDVMMPGMLHARLVTSPHPHARIVSIDTRAARAVLGVVGVFSGRDLPLAKPDASSRNKAPLAMDEVFFNGHPVVAVVAETQAIAADAAALVTVEWEELPAVTDPLEAMKPDAPRVGPGHGGDTEEELSMHGAEAGAADETQPKAPNVDTTSQLQRGDVEAGLAEADVVIERTYTTSMVHQGYLEPHATVASADRLGHVTVWTSTQALFFTRSEVAEALGLPEHRVRVIAMPIGGGFGGKFVLLEPLAAALAVALRRPVSVVMTRNDEFLATTPAPQSRFEVTLGAKRDGTLTALRARVLFDAGAWAGAPLGIACLLLSSYYRFPNLDVHGVEVRTHKPGCGAYRAPGAPQATFAIESAMSEMAERLGLDPLTFRLQNACAGGDPTGTGKPWPRIGLRECLEAVRRTRDEWDRAARAPGNASRDGRAHDVGRGVGVAVGGWMGGVEPASAVCRVNGDGSMSVIVGSVDLSGTNTGLAQLAAEAFGASLEQVQIVNADTESAPYAGASGGSKITYTVGAAVKAAAEDARRQLLEIAADYLDASVHDLDLADGYVRVRGVPDRALTIAKLARIATEFGGKYEPIFGRGASATTARAPGFAAHLCEVEVDRATGAVQIARHVVAQDVGRAVNPAAIEGQIRGGVAQAIGWGLLEHLSYDDGGRLLSGTLMDYTLPKATQMPADVEVILVEVPSESGPFGVRGVGEPPVIAGGAAIANAIADATGVRFTALPITSDAIARAQAESAAPGQRAAA
jgi:CO/xanthine dehydrogenase Mo-binding subunit